MASESEFPARGKIVSIDGSIATFAPAGTNYQLHLDVRDRNANLPADTPVDILIQVDARKVYTVPSGGNFVTPLFGPPRIIQGRVRSATDKTLVVHAGTNFVVNLPQANDAMDLNNGPITVGSMVNVVALPGARIASLE
jgi:hypothetical protein